MIMLYTKNCIYSAISKINGKVYIGKTHCMLKERIRNHKRDSKRKNHISRLYNHVNKYSWDDIEWNVVFALENQKQPTEGERELLCQKEIEYIVSYGALDRDKGFNIMRGGITRPHKGYDKNSKHMKNLWQDESYRAKMSEMLKSKEHKDKVNATRIANGNIAKPKVKIKKIKVKPIQNGIYRVTSKATGLLFFGMTTSGLSYAKSRCNNSNENSKLSNHIKTYGADDLTYDFIFICDSQNKLTENERIELRHIRDKYIAEYDTCNRGLNTAPDDVSDEVRKKIGLMSKNDSLRYDKIRKSEEHKKMVRMASRERQKIRHKENRVLKPKSYNMDDVRKVMEMIKIGAKPRHILAKYNMPTYTKALRELKLASDNP
jgi:hypothetical protein